MYRVSLVGIDSTGKTSSVKSLGDVEGIGTIYTFGKYVGSESRIARISGSLVERLAQFGQQHVQRTTSGFGYVGHLIPYYFEIKANRRKDIVVCDRDPIVDPLCFCESYLPKNISGNIRQPLKLALELFFDYPNLFIYLEASPEVSVQRNKEKKQLHEDVDNLTRVRELYDREIFIVEKKGISVARIDTDTKSLDEVIEKVKHTIEEKSGIDMV